MDEQTARARLERGVAKLNEQRAEVRRREAYVRGDQDLPFAPVGVNLEYVDLQQQSIANFLRIAIDAPVQRLGVDSITTGLGEAADRLVWANVWQANKLDTRQSLVYRSIMVHGRGIVGVFPNRDDRNKPIVRPESVERVWIEPDPDDPFTPLYAVKLYTADAESTTTNGFILPAGMSREVSVGIVYDDETFYRFEKGGVVTAGGWTLTRSDYHPMRRVPFALFDYMPDMDARPWSPIDALMAQQDAINTIRFNTLLAMQFAAFRQRIVTGFDPRVLDKQGNVVYKTNADGTPQLDGNGNMVPMVSSPGRVGVDRMLAFPGEKTSVFDLQESNLANYIEVYDKFLTTFFATAQIPPQYLLSQMANLSGDALAAAESTLASLVKQLQLAAGEGVEDLAALGWRAAGRTEEFDTSAETNWGDREARSFSATADAITKLISVDFPKKDAFAMLPGATKQKVDLWIEHMEDEQDQATLALAVRPFIDATVQPDQAALPAAGPAQAGTVPPGQQVADGAPPIAGA